MKRKSEADTLDHPTSDPVVHLPSPFSSLVRVEMSGLSDVGKVRKNNEDHYLIVRFGRSLQTLMTNLPRGSVPDQFRETGYGMLVADGMGGMAAGEVASRLAIETLMGLVLNTPDWIMRLGPKETEEVMRRSVERFRQVNATLIEVAARDQELAGMGTTMTLAFSVGVNLFIVHVGDSRAYLLRQGSLHKLTRDHTVAQTMIDAGFISPQDEGVRQLQHILTQAVGTRSGKFNPEVQLTPLIDGDQLLLCTDGLTGMVDDDTIASVLQGQESAAGACKNLVDLALEHGGDDNVTVVVARYKIPTDRAKTQEMRV